MSLVELLMATLISSITLTALASLSFYTARSFAAITNYVDMDKKSRDALDRMTQMIRQTDGLLDYDDTELSFSYGGDQVLKYVYTPETRELVQWIDNSQRTLLTECDYLKFDVFKRNPVNGSYDQYPATLDTDSAKIVQVTWLCSRKILGKTMNTESVQSAKIVIRKQ